MYSREERMKAIESCIKYDRCAADVARELGYPDRKSLVSWYEAYLEEQETGVLWEGCTRYARYSLEEKTTAVEHYLEHGRNISRTVNTLRAWCDELAPEARKKRTGGIQYTQEQKKEAVIALCTRTGSAKDIAEEYGVTPKTLYNWKKDLLDKEDSMAMPKEDAPLPDDRDILLSEIETLKRDIRRLKLEKDILEKTAEIVKKDPGVDPKSLINKEKTILIDALRSEHPLRELLDRLGMARSSYFYHHRIASMPDKYERLRCRITELFEKNGRRYGYCRIHALLRREHICVSEKIVRRILLESNLVIDGGKKRKHSSYKGRGYACRRQSDRARLPHGRTECQMAHGHNRVHVPCWEGISFPYGGLFRWLAGQLVDCDKPRCGVGQQHA